MTDEEYFSKISKIEIYTEILLGILRYTSVKNINDENEYKTELTKKLKFENQTDPELFRACIDLVEDSQYAISEVYENGLTIKSEKTDGEIYLRLYGVLNAVYLQLGAIIDLMKLFNIQEQKQIKQHLKSLKIIEFRNKVGSHTTKYNIPNTKEFDFYKLAQSTLSKWGKQLLIVGKDDSEYFDLIYNMKIFTQEIENILEKIVSKEMFDRKFKKEHFEWLKYRYDYIQNNYS
jgi:hypothetical protein